MHKPESVQENETPKTAILVDYSPLARKPDFILINKKRICHLMDFAIPVDHRVKIKENKSRDKYLDLARELKKLWNMKVTVVPIVVDALGTVPPKSGKETGETQDQRKNKDHPDHSTLNMS